jgi:hypothetical protein
MPMVVTTDAIDVAYATNHVIDATRDPISQKLSFGRKLFGQFFYLKNYG